MNAQLLDQARAAYRAGDYSAAAQMFAAVKSPSETSGEVDHLRGNALMKLGMWKDAARAYDRALDDASYGKRGALLTNRGKALAAAGDTAGAVASFTAATQDASYATPYKAFLGLGKVLSASGDVAGAGTAFRSAAIDGTNPAPASALSQLASCFIKLGRPQDAIESYRTALDFIGPRDDSRAINAGLGEAYAAAERFNDALEAFNRATADGIYQLTPEQLDGLRHAQEAIGSLSALSAGIPAAGTSGTIDPLDPLGSSGSMMPDPSDTGFFTLSESEMIQQDRRDMRVRRRHRHVGRKIAIILLIVILIAAAGLGFAYTRGLGFPTQADAISGLFDAVNGDGDATRFIDPGLSDSAREALIKSVPRGAAASIESMDQSMTQTKANVRVTLSKGGTPHYTVQLVRDGNHLGWVVSELKMNYGGTKDTTPSADTDSDSAASPDTTGSGQNEDTDANTGDSSSDAAA